MSEGAELNIGNRNGHVYVRRHELRRHPSQHVGRDLHPMHNRARSRGFRMLARGADGGLAYFKVEEFRIQVERYGGT